MMIWPARFVALFALMAFLPLTTANDQDVWDPVITSPKAGTVWYIGEEVHVTWDKEQGRPAHITNTKGDVQLVHNQRLTNVLADNFDIRKGSVRFRVPDVKPGVYQVDLFGDSGNWSPEFKIARR